MGRKNRGPFSSLKGKSSLCLGEGHDCFTIAFGLACVAGEIRERVIFGGKAAIFSRSQRNSCATRLFTARVHGKRTRARNSASLGMLRVGRVVFDNFSIRKNTGGQAKLFLPSSHFPIMFMTAVFALLYTILLVLQISKCQSFHQGFLYLCF